MIMQNIGDRLCTDQNVVRNVLMDQTQPLIRQNIKDSANLVEVEKMGDSR